MTIVPLDGDRAVRAREVDNTVGVRGITLLLAAREGNISPWGVDRDQYGRKVSLRGVVVVGSRIKLERRGEIKLAFFEAFKGQAQLLLYGELHVTL